VYTGCCADQCTPCGVGDCTEIASKLISQINADADGFLVASAYQNMIGATVTAGATTAGSLTVTVGTTVYTVPVATSDTAAQVAGKIAAVINTQAGSPYTAVASGATLKIYVEGAGTGTFALTAAGGTGVTVGSITASTKTNVTDIPAFAAANPGACLGIRITTVPSAIQSFCGVNTSYNKVRATDIQVSLVDGFTCNGVVTTIQEARNSEGVGADLQQLEYFAGGWNGKPGVYRVSPSTSLAKGMTTYAIGATLYQQLDLTYDQLSVGGWLEYFNNLRTIIAIPCTDTTTTTGLVAILDLIFTQFQPMANDVAANNDCDNPNVSTLLPATDGVESLA
jgi:archaellum component FlaG (FlaF/FlaG flagellin family)